MSDCWFINYFTVTAIILYFYYDSSQDEQNLKAEINDLKRQLNNTNARISRVFKRCKHRYKHDKSRDSTNNL